MKIIGITGRSGSGKSYISSMLVDAIENSIELDCDKIYNTIVCHNNHFLLELKEVFGCDVVDKNAQLNRPFLRELVFNNKSKLNLLNNIAHRYVRNYIDDFISKTNKEYVFINAPQLFESGIDKICDIKIGIITSKDAEISRIVLRDSISEEDAILRLSSQYSNDFFIENCDYVFNNDTENINLADLIKYIEGK